MSEIKSNSSFCARLASRSSSTKKVISNSVAVAVIDLTTIECGGRRQDQPRSSAPHARGSRRRRSAASWHRAGPSRSSRERRMGELALTIFALAIVLFGTIARSRLAVRTWVARQFISMTRPSVPPSMLIQSPGR